MSYIPATILSPEPITLGELDRVRLMNRVDTKFTFRAGEVDTLLQEAAPHYRMLEMDGKRLFRYTSLYFDTPEYTFYYQHHRGCPNRSKIRLRRYEDSGDAYFELKQKVKFSRTDKHRIRYTGAGEMPGPEEEALLAAYGLAHLALQPAVRVRFDRITLAANHDAERITLDLNLTVEDEHRFVAFPGIAILEVKQERFRRTSPAVSMLRRRNIHEIPVSKYMVGVARLKPVKSNMLKEKLIHLNQLMQP